MSLSNHSLGASIQSQKLFCVNKVNTQRCRKLLTKLGAFDASRKILQLPGKLENAIPIRPDSLSPLQMEQFEFEFEIIEMPLENAIKLKPVTPYDKLVAKLTELIAREQLHSSILSEVPCKWERFGDLVLLPHKSFGSGEWDKCGDLWKLVASALGCRRLARNSPVSSDDFRQSKASMLFGDSGWVEHSENGISYCFDVTQCMFSSGNVTEKLRLSQLDCSDEVVVDLFAGIGYFTLTYLVHCRAKLVHACEWNPNALKALEASLIRNSARGRCVVHAGDNRVLAPEGVADRVNLGLLPSSEISWHTACRCLRPCGGIVAVHGNVNSLSLDPRLYKFSIGAKDKYSAKEVWCMWSEMVRNSFQNMLDETRPLLSGCWEVRTAHLERVKSYAPHIDHLVVELDCRPPGKKT